MQKLTTLILMTLIGVSMWGQEWTNTNIKLTNPNEYPWGINLNGTYSGGWAREFSFSHNSTGKLFSFGVKADADKLVYGYIGGNIKPNTTCYNNTWMVFKPNGNVGIGNVDPKNKLEISNAFSFHSGGHKVIGLGYSISSGAMQDGYMGEMRWDPVGGSFYIRTSSMTYLKGQIATMYDRITIRKDGNVGIGTTNPGTNKLAVNGTIKAKEIKVDITGWSDFVFANNYQLKPLTEVETFINENNHLPDIPSEAEVKANGVNLGEMDAKLLQKIEELTLYMIEQNKRLEKLEKENTLLKAKLEL